MGLLFAFIVVILLYQVQTGFLARGLWHKIESGKPVDTVSDSVAILIVHRNDTQALLSSLESIQKALPGNYQWPIYLLDDHSSVEELERLKALLARFPFELVKSKTEPGKKKALAWLLPQLSEEYILQIDADCQVETDFFERLNSKLSKVSADLLVARVEMRPSKNIWSRLAALDHLSLQLVTFSGLAQSQAVMAAGAAMCFRRARFIELSSYGSKWAGGEDTFFTQALGKAKGQIEAIPEAVVYTEAPSNFSSFIRQRLRWGAKSVDYINNWSRFLAINVALSNVFILLGLSCAVLGLEVQLVWLFWMLKLLADGLLLYRFADLYGGAKLLRGYLFLALLYPFYIALVVALIPFAKKDQWLAS